MYKKILFLIGMFSFPIIGETQTLNSEAGIITCGGRLIQGASNSGSCSIGLPFVGQYGNGINTTLLGLYVGQKPGTHGFSVDLKQLDFRDVKENSSLQKSFVLTNKSSGELQITITVGPTSVPFSVASGDYALLKNGGSKTIVVTFSPTTQGVAIDSITISSTGLVSQTVTLTGNGTVNGGVKQILAQDMALTLYPNPTTGAFTITIPENLNHIQAFLYDERGAQILDATSSITRNASDRLEFFLKNVPSGSYMLDLRSDKENLLYKLNLIK